MSLAAGGEMELSEDAQMELALQMSKGDTSAPSGEQSNVSASLQDADFLNSVLTTLPGEFEQLHFFGGIAC
jgi:hypothetical protein